MSKVAFLFVGASFLLLPIFTGSGPIHHDSLSFICLGLIFLLGIPHGAADNALYLSKNPGNPSRFIGLYLLTIALNVALWLFWPPVAYVSFLILSAYHFGQSQFSHYFERQGLLQRCLYMAWGLAMFAALLYFNHEQLLQWTTVFSDLSTFAPFHQPTILLALWILSSMIVVSLGLYLAFRQMWPWEKLIMELFLAGLLLLGFMAFPFLVAFTLYFIILHALKVMREQYQFFKKEAIAASVGQYLSLILPFSLFSIGGTALLFSLSYWHILPISMPYLALILMSSITVPHAYVMERFYDFRLAKAA